MNRHRAWQKIHTRPDMARSIVRRLTMAAGVREWLAKQLEMLPTAALSRLLDAVKQTNKRGKR